MEYMHRGSLPPAPYMPMPRYLLELPISSTAKILYTVLLSRALLSAQQDGWQDEHGRVYQYYTIEDLSKTVNKCKNAILDALVALEKYDLIERQRQAPGRANRIFVKVQPEEKQRLPGPEKQTPRAMKTVLQGPRKPHANNKIGCIQDNNGTYLVGGYETL